MKKEYKNTIEEATDASVRLAEIVGIVRRQKWLGLWFMPFVFAMFYLIVRHDMAIRLITAGFMSAVVFVVHVLTVKDQLRRNARRIIVKAQGTAEPVSCEYELTDENLIFRKLGQELRFGWQTVTDVRVSPSAVEVLMQPTGIAIIPTRIFDRQDELQAWIRFIEDHRTASKVLNRTVDPGVSMSG